MKFFIVLFKNKERKKIINKFKTYERAIEKFINPYKTNWQYRYYKSVP